MNKVRVLVTNDEIFSKDNREPLHEILICGRHQIRLGEVSKEPRSEPKGKQLTLSQSVLLQWVMDAIDLSHTSTTIYCAGFALMLSKTQSLCHVDTRSARNV